MLPNAMTTIGPKLNIMGIEHIEDVFNSSVLFVTSDLAITLFSVPLYAFMYATSHLRF